MLCLLLSSYERKRGETNQSELLQQQLYQQELHQQRHDSPLFRSELGDIILKFPKLAQLNLIMSLVLDYIYYTNPDGRLEPLKRIGGNVIQSKMLTLMLLIVSN